MKTGDFAMDMSIGLGVNKRILVQGYANQFFKHHLLEKVESIKWIIPLLFYTVVITELSQFFTLIISMLSIYAIPTDFCFTSVTYFFLLALRSQNEQMGILRVLRTVWDMA